MSNFICRHFLFVVAAVVALTSSTYSPNVGDGSSAIFNSRFISLPGSIVFANAKFVHEVDGDFDPDEFDGIDNLDDRDSGYDEDDFDEEEEVVPTRKKKEETSTVDDEDDEDFADEEWEVDDSDLPVDSDKIEGDEEDEFSDFDRVEAAAKKQKKKSHSREQQKRAAGRGKKKAGSRDNKPSANVQKIRKRIQTDFTYELIAGVIILLYGFTYFWGSAVNSRKALTWVKKFRSLYTEQFVEIGNATNTNQTTNNPSELLLKESQASFYMFASGRANCRGVTTEIQLRPRQDLLSMCLEFLNPTNDILKLEVCLGKDTMDPFIFAILPKRGAKDLLKEGDLKDYSPKERKVESLPESLACYCDNGEVQSVLLNQSATEIIKKHLKCFHSLHFTDKYTMPPLGMIKPSRMVLCFKFKILSEAKDPGMESLKQLLKFAFRYIDLVVEKTRLSAKAKAKAEKARAIVLKKKLSKSKEEREEAFQKRRDAKFKAQQEKYKRMSAREQEKFDEKQRKKEIKKAMRSRTKIVR